jgi:pycsar effector protein
VRLLSDHTMNPAGPSGEIPAANPAPAAEPAERLAKDLLDRTRAETTQAENKAAVLLAGVLAGTGGIAAAVGGKWHPQDRPWYVIALFSVAAIAALLAIICLTAAIYPRGRAQPDHKLTTIGYFGDVLMLDSPGQLRVLLSQPDTRLLDVWTDQIWQASLIVGHKYRFIRWSIRLLGVALAFAVGVVIVTTARGR